MLAEVRALREGIVIADQLPTSMAPEILKNTTLKITHRITSEDDRNLIGSSMSASNVQLEELSTYPVSYTHLLRPILVMEAWLMPAIVESSFFFISLSMSSFHSFL